jgi:hypothetical protein
MSDAAAEEPLDIDVTAGIKGVRRLSEPDDRLGRLAQAMLNAFEAHPEYGDDVQVIVMIDTPTEGTIAHLGYGGIDDDDSDVFAAMVNHLGAIAKANGMKMEMFGIPDSPEGL